MATFEEKNARQGQVKRLDHKKDKTCNQSNENVHPENPGPSVEGECLTKENPIWLFTVDKLLTIAIVAVVGHLLLCSRR